MIIPIFFLNQYSYSQVMIASVKLKSTQSGYCIRRPWPPFKDLSPLSHGLFCSRGYSPVKVRGVLVVPSRGSNFWIGTAFGAKT